jgi:SH3-like domain-containing protein
MQLNQLQSLKLGVLLLSFSLSQYPQIVKAEYEYRPCFQGASAGYVRPRLTIGVKGYSLIKKNINIRYEPGIDSKIIGQLSPRKIFKVLDGPQCRDGFVWWKIDHGKIKGWVAEADPSTFVYWLKPY